MVNKSAVLSGVVIVVLGIILATLFNMHQLHIAATIVSGVTSFMGGVLIAVAPYIKSKSV